MAECLHDLLRQRVYGIACGYEDCNDAARFENALGPKSLMRMGMALADTVVARYRKRLCGWARRITVEFDGRVAALGATELFRTLDAGGLAVLAEHSQVRRVSRGRTVIEQGAAGSSMFVLLEGFLVIDVAADDESVCVANVSPGQCFGEMTLLTGETRTATALADRVLLEVGFEAMRTPLHKRSELAEVLARRLDEYRRQNEERVGERSASNTEIGVRQSGLLARIRNVFSLG